MNRSRSTQSHPLPLPEDEPTVPLWPTAARSFGIGRSTAYDLASRGEFPAPVIRVGRNYRVPTARLRQVLGMDLVAS